MPNSALPYILMMGLMFGSTLLASRFSVGQFNSVTFVGLRLVIAATAFLLVYLVSAQRHFPRDRELWRRATVLGIFGTAIPMLGFVGSLNYQSAGVTALLLTTAPAFTVIFAHFLLPDEPLSRRKVIGVLLALGGAGLLVGSGQSGLPDVSRANPVGYVLAIGAIMVDSLAVIYARKNMSHMPPFDVTSVRTITAALLVFPLSLLFVGFDLSAVDRAGYTALFYTALVANFGGMLLAFFVASRFGATSFSMTAYVIPIVAAVGGVLLLGETITAVMVGGMVLIIAGVFIINRKRPLPVELMS